MKPMRCALLKHCSTKHIPFPRSTIIRYAFPPYLYEIGNGLMMMMPFLAVSLNVGINSSASLPVPVLENKTAILAEQDLLKRASLSFKSTSEPSPCYAILRQSQGKARKPVSPKTPYSQPQDLFLSYATLSIRRVGARDGVTSVIVSVYIIVVELVLPCTAVT